jgi:hypothetical protein
MNAHALDLTRVGLISALAPVAEKNLGDVIPQHVHRLQLLFPTVTHATPVSEILPRILRRLEQVQSKRKFRHWSFDANELIALQLFASALQEEGGEA